MARMYPSKVQNFHGSQGEKQVYEALESLNNDYTVFYSYRWLGNYQQHRSEGEADFLVLHPRKGILSIEVKAGGIAYQAGRWIQLNRNIGSEKVIDPLGQAAESQYKIRNLLRNKFGFKYSGLVVGRAAWFTSVCVDEKLSLPAEATLEIILDETALDFPQEALEKAFSYWKENLGRSRELNQAEFREIVKFLMPTFEMAETITSYAREEEKSYVQLTRRQGAVLHFLQEQPMAAIHGPAGTGKTLLALQKVKMLAEEGKKVLYLCFNEFLLSYMRRSGYDKEHITFHNVRTLAEELMHNKSLPINEIIPTFEKYFGSAYDDDKWEYPNIVVDEGQDISDSVLEHLAFLAEVNEGIFYVFYDRNQYIMRKDKPEWVDKNVACRLVLYKNCRNTAEIAQLAGGMVGIKTKNYINEVHGLNPEWVEYRNADELRKIATQFVREMRERNVALDDMVILTVRSIKHSLLKVDKLNNIEVTEKYEKSKVRFTSVRKFKGLEAKAVLLIDAKVSELEDALTQRLLYVGCTRAGSYLKVAVLNDK